MKLLFLEYEYIECASLQKVFNPLTSKPLVLKNWNNTGELGQYHGCWCPGSFHRQAINNHAIDNVTIWTTWSIAVLRNYSKCRCFTWKSRMNLYKKFKKNIISVFSSNLKWKYINFACFFLTGDWYTNQICHCTTGEETWSPAEKKVNAYKKHGH